MSLWNGKAGAICLTFDDGLPCQITYAIPLLNDHGLHATFFLIPNSPFDTEFRTEAWKAAIASGHEIGSHSMNHRKAAEITQNEAYDECLNSKVFLYQNLGVKPVSFCYPFTDAHWHVQAEVRKFYLQARGGRVARRDKFVTRKDGDVNLWNVPCFHVGPSTIKDVPDWIDEAIERRAWVTLMMHGVGEEGTWDNVSLPDFNQMLDLIATKQHDLWVPTFGEAAESFRKFGEPK